MTSFRVVVVMLLVVGAVVLAAGCSGNISEKEPAGNEIPVIPSITAVSTGQVKTDTNSNEEMIQPLLLYRQNLTYPINKIPKNLLQITDPNFPELDFTREQARAQLITQRHLLPPDAAIKRFNLTNSSGQILGDQVFLTIYVFPGNSTHILDPVVTIVTNRKEGFHGVEAWVDVSNVEKIAAMDGVRSLQFVEFADHS